MQIADITLALGGDSGNTIHKYGVTPGEVALLEVIHGGGSVTDITITGAVKTSNREELQRLKAVYGGAKDGDGKPIVEHLYPGIGARVFVDFDELELPEQQFKVAPRAKPVAAVPDVKDIDDMSKAELLAHARSVGVNVDASDKKADILAAIKGAQARDPETAEDDDGIDDMPDAAVFE